NAKIMDTAVKPAANNLVLSDPFSKLEGRLFLTIAIGILFSGAGCAILDTGKSPAEHSASAANPELANYERAGLRPATGELAADQSAPKPAVQEKSAVPISFVHTGTVQSSPAPRTGSVLSTPKAAANVKNAVAADASTKGATRLVMPATPIKPQAKALITSGPLPAGATGIVAARPSLPESTPQQLVIKGPPRQPTPAHSSAKWFVIIGVLLGAGGVGGFAWHHSRRRVLVASLAPAQKEKLPPGLEFKELALEEERITEPLPEPGAASAK
ncbi:MAG TPA: hypothetical protein VLT36_06280, partial [Candidatus Dormibacteraeota bacterium]|nr:hypothetical protein [Candidatus Dormibacteraeota bacterium]